ncbi:MAG: sulfite exporter TauE/SafE family protein [Burkholderiaceae bacterium]|mgnify:FL=1|nr:sulfite exporter TauE/SafE family protein [Burkholderiaceae bacterium]MDP4697342.1 sulfite exporter TauE/SafE family protein [Burkholderiaceae bacterium]
MQDTALILSGLIIGAIIGLTGVGGGSLMTPLLIMGFGVNPAIAVGTDLLFAAATKLGGTVRLARERLIAWRAVGLLSVGSLPAALLTMAVLQHLGPSSAETEQLIRQVLGVALLLTALATLHNVLASQRKKNAVLANNDPAGAAGAAGAADLADTANATPAHWALPVLFGALIGSVVTLTSVGAGAIGVTALLILFPRLAIQRIIAVDLAYAVPLTLFAGLGHASLGQVDWHLLGLLLCGSLPGIWLGSRLLKSLNPQVTRTLLSTLLATIGIKLLAW